jgi:hypothetical protein
MTQNPSTKSAWIQLYEARRVMTEAPTRMPGRPPAPIPRRKIGLTLSQGEIHELETWQERFSKLLRRKVSIGETAGILTRICTARMESISNDNISPSLAELVEKMIGRD